MEADFDLMEMALERARKDGADDADAYVERETGLSIKIFDEDVEKFAYSETAGIGVRVFIEGRTGRAYTSDLSREAVERAVEQAHASALVSPADENQGLCDPGLYPAGAGAGAYLGEELGIWSDDIAGTGPGDKIEFAIGLEKRAREHDEKVTGVETAVYGESSTDVLLANTRGFNSGYRSSVCYGYLMAIAGKGHESQTGFGFTAGRSFEALDAGDAAREAADMAVRLLGARQVESARVPVLLDNLTASELVALVGAALSAESVVKGRSFLTGLQGETVASKSFELSDEGLLHGGYGTAPFDGEGAAEGAKPLIKAGRLETFLHNCYTASRMGERSTGNAGRSSFRASVGVSPTNLVLKPGRKSRDELREDMGTGFEIAELQGVHVGLNPVTGEVSVGAKGWWVDGGEQVHAVREVTIAGRMLDILKGVRAAGSDMRYTPLVGGVGAPSLLVEGFTISGT